MPRQLTPIHPGEILREDFLKPMNVTVEQLARELGVPPAHASGIIDRTQSITADDARRLAGRFGVSSETWLGLQAEYDLRRA